MHETKRPRLTRLASLNSVKTECVSEEEGEKPKRSALCQFLGCWSDATPRSVSENMDTEGETEGDLLATTTENEVNLNDALVRALINDPHARSDHTTVKDLNRLPIPRHHTAAGKRLLFWRVLGRAAPTCTTRPGPTPLYEL